MQPGVDEAGLGTHEGGATLPRRDELIEVFGGYFADVDERDGGVRQSAGLVAGGHRKLEQ
ncbi:hypothetical protein ACWDZZ_11035 [Streptomyces sp. NPDC002990]